MFPPLKFWLLMKFDFSSRKGVLVVKFAFATANLKTETLRMRRRFARVFARVQKVRDFPQTKLDNGINSPFLLNEHVDPRFFFRYLLRTV